MAERVNLDWIGPSEFVKNTLDNEGIEDGPACYVWTLSVDGAYRVAYVGETSSVMTRWSQHLMWLLGGGYWVFDPAALQNGDFSADKCKYKCEAGRHLKEFVESYLAIALENARLYQFWFARLDDPRFLDPNWRKSVESALQYQLKQQGLSPQNGRFSKSREKAYAVECVCRWPAGVMVRGLPSDELILYGELIEPKR